MEFHNRTLRESAPYFDSLSLIICACLSAIRKNKAGGTLSPMAQVILAIRDRTGRPLC